MRRSMCSSARRDATRRGWLFLVWLYMSRHANRQRLFVPTTKGSKKPSCREGLSAKNFDGVNMVAKCFHQRGVAWGGPHHIFRVLGILLKQEGSTLVCSYSAYSCERNLFQFPNGHHVFWPRLLPRCKYLYISSSGRKLWAITSLCLRRLGECFGCVLDTLFIE